LKNIKGEDVFHVVEKDKFLGEFKDMYEQIRKGGKDANNNGNTTK
jgi:hypothetical protein